MTSHALTGQFDKDLVFEQEQPSPEKTLPSDTPAASEQSDRTVVESHRLIEEGQALVRSLACRIHRSIPVKVDLEDLIAYGELGLAEAARDFDPSQGSRFSTFAYYRIQGSIYDGLAKMTWTSRSRYKRLRYEPMAEETLDRINAEIPDGKSIHDRGRWFGHATEKLAVVYLASGEDGERSSEAEMLADRGEAAPQMAIHREAGEKLRQLVDLLPHDESRLVKLIYFEGYTLQEAGNRLGISRSWASRMHARILERLAGQLRRLDLHD